MKPHMPHALWCTVFAGMLLILLCTTNLNGMRLCRPNSICCLLFQFVLAVISLVQSDPGNGQLMLLVA